MTILKDLFTALTTKPYSFFDLMMDAGQMGALEIEQMDVSAVFERLVARVSTPANDNIAGDRSENRAA